MAGQKIDDDTANDIDLLHDLIGRALRSVCDFQALGERTLWLDCDVLQADGGTRTASITGGWIAVAAALKRRGLERALVSRISAVSVGSPTSCRRGIARAPIRRGGASTANLQKLGRERHASVPARTKLVVAA